MKRFKLFSLVVAVVMFCTILSGCSSSAVTLTFLNWGEYLDPALITEFEKEYPNIKISQKLVTSNEEMYSVCSTADTQVDLLTPSDYLVEQLLKANLLAEIDTSKLSNYKYVEESAQNRSFDPNNKYSIPYMMGTLGIVYNKTMVDEPVDSWNILWNEKYSKKILMYDSIRDLLAVSFCRLGYDINTVNETEIQKAGEDLIKQRPLVLGYETDSIKTSMIAGNAAVAVDYSGAAVAAIMENPDLDYVVPKEGSNIWMDNLVIINNSKNKEAAMTFIDFLCRPDVSARNSEYIGYTTPNLEAQKLMPEEYTSNSAYSIPEDVVTRCKYYVDLGDSLKLYNEVWMEIKSS